MLSRLTYLNQPFLFAFRSLPPFHNTAAFDQSFAVGLWSLSPFLSRGHLLGTFLGRSVGLGSRPPSSTTQRMSLAVHISGVLSFFQPALRCPNASLPFTHNSPARGASEKPGLLWCCGQAVAPCASSPSTVQDVGPAACGTALSSLCLGVPSPGACCWWCRSSRHCSGWRGSRRYLQMSAP